MHPPAIRRLIDLFNILPGIGPKTSERFVFFLLTQSESDLQRFAQAFMELKKTLVTCQLCGQYADTSLCSICRDNERDRTKMCVVAFSQDIQPIEKTGRYRGLYHVLGGVINQIENITPDDLHIDTLFKRLNNNGFQELLIATNPDVEGETTALYLAKMVQSLPLRVTRLARGLPVGADIEYADEITLASAIEGRRTM